MTARDACTSRLVSGTTLLVDTRNNTVWGATTVSLSAEKSSAGPSESGNATTYNNNYSYIKLLLLSIWAEENGRSLLCRK